MVNKLIVNKLSIVFTYLRNDSVFGFAQVSGASRADNFCCSGRPQISSFFFDNAKVQKIHSPSKLFLKKSTQKSTHVKNTPHASQISDLSFYFATPLYRKLLKVYNNIIYILYYYKNIIINIFLFILSAHTPMHFLIEI